MIRFTEYPPAPGKIEFTSAFERFGADNDRLYLGAQVIGSILASNMANQTEATLAAHALIKTRSDLSEELFMMGAAEGMAGHVCIGDER